MDHQIGVLSFPDCRMSVHTSRMCPLTTHETPARTGWGFLIAAEPPFDPLPHEDELGDFPRGAALYADDEPIPLSVLDDLTGVEFVLNESYNAESGEVYFTFDASEACDVSNVCIRFLERNGTRYRVEIKAIVHQVYEQPTELQFSGWVDVVDHLWPSPSE
jgi:hypothetical protein